LVVHDHANSGDSDAMNILGVLAHQRGDYATAIEIWKKSYQANDVSAPVLISLASR
jgi:hypothetical protein